MKTFNKILSLALVVVLVSQMPVQKVSAESVDKLDTQIEVIEQKTDGVGNIIYEVVKAENDSYYFFEKEGDIVISYSYYNGNVEYAINDQSNIYLGNFQTNLADWKEIKDYACQKIGSSGSRSISSYVSSESRASSSEQMATIKTLMRQQSGFTEYSMKLLKTKTTALSAFLYGSISFSVSKIGDIHIQAGAGISLVLALLGLSAGTAMSILVFAIAADGIYHTVAANDVSKYNAVVNRLKMVQVRDYYPYNSYSNIVYPACGIKGSRDATVAWDKSSYNECLDYYDDDAILLTGLKNAGF